jgi:hypothetical protein
MHIDPQQASVSAYGGLIANRGLQIRAQLASEARAWVEARRAHDLVNWPECPAVVAITSRPPSDRSISAMRIET